MIRVGVIGMGMMGATHLDAYGRIDGAKVVAVADRLEERRSGRRTVAGNVDGQSQGGVDFSSFRQYDEGLKLIADPEVDLIDICLPTPLHAEYAIAALRAGRHVLVEKPFARDSRQGAELLAAAQAAPGLLMCAMCMRFWPAWAWLKRQIDAQPYGRTLAAHFRRVTSHPGGPFYGEGQACGGAILDLHVHDTDFVQHCFGLPQAVFSRGYAKETEAFDHVITHYIYDHVPLVVAEGGWSFQPGYGFQMQYTVNFERATAIFDLAGQPQLRVVADGQSTAIEVAAGMGYEHEIRYFLDCIRQGLRPTLVDPASALRSLHIVEAEVDSVRTGQVVRLAPRKVA